MLSIKDLEIAKKVLIAPIIAVIFLIALALFSNDSLKSNKSTLKEIVEVKFELYETSSEFLTNMKQYNTTLYKVFNYVTGALKLKYQFPAKIIFLISVQ